jgi:hypothetical protein
MDPFFEKLKKDAVEVNLEDSIQFIESKIKNISGKIVSPYPTINGIDIKFSLGKRHIKFNAEGFAEYKGGLEPAAFQRRMYGYCDPFYVINQKDVYYVNKGTSKVSIALGKDLSADGEISSMSCDFDEAKSYYRFIQRTEDGAGAIFHTLGKAFIIKDSVRVAGYTTLNIDSHILGIFDCDFLDNRAIVIDALTPIDYATFEKIVNSAIMSIALVGGNLHKNRKIFLKSEDENFKKITGFKLINTGKSILTGYELFNPWEEKEFLNIEKQNHISENFVSNLITLTLNDIRVFRSIKIIAEARIAPKEIATAAYFVALETIKNIIIEKNEDNIAPFKNKKIAKNLIDRIKELINIIDEDEFNNKIAVERKVDDLNKLGNNESFFKVFQILNIELSKQDKDCLKARNRFLHGNVPFVDEPDENKLNQLQIIELKAHSLTCALILKMAGYEGYMKNSLKFIDAIGYDNSSEEPFFRKI